MPAWSRNEAMQLLAMPKRSCCPLRLAAGILGSLTVHLSPINASRQQLLNTLTDNLATAIFLQKRIEEEQQLSLVNERTIIARELHDSLAQSLSYLKMQVTAWNVCRRMQFSAEQHAWRYRRFT